MAGQGTRERHTPLTRQDATLDAIVSYRYLAPAFLAMDEARRPSTAEPGLSRRERDVLRLVASGKTDREIADALVVSQHTIANHVRHIRAKLDVATRAAAVAAAILAGWL